MRHRHIDGGRREGGAMPRRTVSRLLISIMVVVGFTAALPVTAAVAHGPDLDLETLTGAQAEKMMARGQLTSVQLTRAYLARIDALNKRGPGLNAVTQINPDAMHEAEVADRERAAGHLLGPAH